MTKQLPLFLNCQGLPVLVAGSSHAAVSKAVILLERGALVTLVGRSISAVAAESGLLTPYRDQTILLDRPFSEDDLAGQELVYIAESDPHEEERILTWARLHKKRINVVDKPHLSDFFTPAAVERGPISIAISSGGAAPVFVRRIRAVLETALPQSLSSLASIAGSLRPTLKGILTKVKERRDFWDSVYDEAESYYGLREGETATKLLAEARRQADEATQEGLVQLVGAGPGDPDLLTLSAHRALQRADIILYDRLVSTEVLALARRDAEFLYVGKKEGNHGVGQDGIQDLLIQHAKKGKRVVRLKGGDPLTFARAGEELSALRTAHIDVQVIPGITALTGIAAKIQIPLTDRSHAASLSLVTGTLQDGSSQDWEQRALSLAGPGKTMAVYMGLNKAAAIESGLIKGGVTPSTPVAIVENGTRAEERQFYTTLGALSTTIAEEKVTSPALLIIGDVVREAKALATPEDFHLEDNSPLALSA